LWIVGGDARIAEYRRPHHVRLITAAVLTTGGNTAQLGFHLGRAVENGVTLDELIEAITHVTLYVGWPKGMAAISVAKQLFADNK
jgi:4-carboxymuconolactone decarboxylase